MKKSYTTYGNYDKYPQTDIKGYDNQAFSGYSAIAHELTQKLSGGRTIIVLDCYPNVDYKELLDGFALLNPVKVICSDNCAISAQLYKEKIADNLTDDRVFGFMSHKKIDTYFDYDKLQTARTELEAITNGVVLVYGVGASLITKGDILIHCDLARWEIQTRYKQGASNWNTDNRDAPILTKYKQGFFVEWRFADKHKQNVWKDMDYVLDTNVSNSPKMITSSAFFEGLSQVVSQPFRVVPYFDPGVWGGQWMKDVCSLPQDKANYAWSFDGVPEENSLYMVYGDVRVEVPSIDLVFYQPQKLLGERVHGRFGAEFPIRFDFLDTMGGQNLSLQVHPLTEYIQQNFGMNYTQDESYYILDTDETEETFVYLGVKENVDSTQMIADLNRAQNGEISFPAEKYVNKIAVKKHDHILIPAGTIHCSATNTMVLEISATPYIFTFKLFDWDRLGLDGLPRPIHIEHGEKVIQWDRDTKWVHDNLVNNFTVLEKTDTLTVTKTGLHEREFIETVTHRTTQTVHCTTKGSVNMLNLVEGIEAIIQSPTNSFENFIVHYAETFIIPAHVDTYTITPYGKSEGKEIMTITAYVR
ncbi:MAG: class I mannose-6-phosphate isomerase [Oscillospiraceae bacterium]